MGNNSRRHKRMMVPIYHRELNSICLSYEIAFVSPDIVQMYIVHADEPEKTINVTADCPWKMGMIIFLDKEMWSVENISAEIINGFAYWNILLLER